MLSCPHQGKGPTSLLHVVQHDEDTAFVLLAPRTRALFTVAAAPHRSRDAAEGTGCHPEIIIKSSRVCDSGRPECAFLPALNEFLAPDFS